MAKGTKGGPMKPPSDSKPKGMDKPPAGNSQGGKKGGGSGGGGKCR